MQHCMLKAKIHRASVTHTELDYEGSCAIAADLLDAAGIHAYEQIHIYNINNGERFITYAIRAEEHSGIISINGAAAHKASPKDLIIICAYAQFADAELAVFKPKLVYVDAHNKIMGTRGEIPTQLASCTV